MIVKLPPLGHVGIVVADMEQALPELRALYGLSGLGAVYDFKPLRVWAWGREIEGCHIKICMADWTETVKMEVLQPVFGDIEHARFVQEVGGGLHHTAYYVKEYEAYKKFVLEQGGTIIFEAETEDARGYRRCLYARFPQTRALVEILEIARPRNA